MMRILVPLLLCALLCALLGAAPALARNPFMGGGGDGGKQGTGIGRNQGSAPASKPDPEKIGAGKGETVAPVKEPGFFRALRVRLAPLQRQLKERLSQYIKVLKESTSLGTLFWFLLFSFAYGVIHAMGPGHGKAVASFYFLSRKGTLAQGLLMGFLMGFLHAASASAVVLVTYFVLSRSVMARFEAAGGVIEAVSFLLIALIGLVLTARVVYALIRRKPLHVHEHGHENPSKGRGFLLVALVAGMVPCPGAAIILLFTLALKAPWLGLASVGAMALGMGFTISATALLAVYFRKSVLAAALTRPRIFGAVHAGLALIGSSLVFLLGSALFLGSL
ncbi:MAG: hypothetical protein SVS15_01840 [Thermodesulfobacteriota bacterium]|nr:hypothetical protein [Thermodesulfobacteriota bacterium]